MTVPTMVNLLGGPGAGKTTTGLLVTAKLKMLGHEVEFVSEVARDRAYESRLATTDQFDLLKEQLLRQARLVGTGIRFAVTDSPMILQAAYCTSSADRDRAVWAHKALPRLNFFLRSPRENHSMVGRAHTADEAEVIDDTILDLLSRYHEPFVAINAENAADEIIGRLFEPYGENRNE